jgi:hypothetical protein
MSLVFVSAQPDIPYFHWQCEVYLNNFIDLGIDPKNIHILFAMVNGQKTPSNEALKLLKYTKNIHFYEDTRDKKHYIPSIKPFLINKWLKQFPQHGKSFFLHDSDIIFNYLPQFDLMLNDDITYMSNTKGYISYSYIMDCGKRYSKKHDISEERLINDMCFTVGIEPYIVKNGESKSGGAQYILKNQTEQMWFKIYKDSNRLYDVMVNFNKKYPITNGEIQIWTAEMWSILWNMWYWGYRTEITPLIDFCWGTDDIEKCETHPILHMAGVTEEQKGSLFFKGDYINVNPIDSLNKDINHFNYVKNTSTGVKYINEIKKFIQK